MAKTNCDQSLGRVSYGSIPHLPSSRLGPSDRSLGGGQVRIATERARDRFDVVIAQEKLDGANVSVVKVAGELVALTRGGRRAAASPMVQFQWFAAWVRDNQQRFDALLEDGERACGEWLAQAHGTRYQLIHEPFVLFDLMRGTTRATVNEVRCRSMDFTMPCTIHEGAPVDVDTVRSTLHPSGHGALDPVEGAVWRIERHHPKLGNNVDFLCKWVRPDKIDGHYMPEFNPEHTAPVWNWKPNCPLVTSPREQSLRGNRLGSVR